MDRAARKEMDPMSDLFEAGLRIDEGASVSADDVVGGDGPDNAAFDAVEAKGPSLSSKSGMRPAM